MDDPEDGEWLVGAATQPRSEALPRPSYPVRWRQGRRILVADAWAVGEAATLRWVTGQRASTHSLRLKAARALYLSPWSSSQPRSSVVACEGGQYSKRVFLTHQTTDAGTA